LESRCSTLKHDWDGAKKLLAEWGAVLDDCGHFLPEECPDEFVRALTGFWASWR
jgi:pimeloyl-ACP methyl ester carboxylesterase